jgi:hypothetical protein
MTEMHPLHINFRAVMTNLKVETILFTTMVGNEVSLQKRLKF